MDENHKQTRSDNGLETLQAVHRLNSNKAKIWWSWLRDRGTSSHRYVQNTPITPEDSMRVLVATSTLIESSGVIGVFCTYLWLDVPLSLSQDHQILALLLFSLCTACSVSRPLSDRVCLWFSSIGSVLTFQPFLVKPRTDLKFDVQVVVSFCRVHFCTLAFSAWVAQCAQSVSLTSAFFCFVPNFATYRVGSEICEDRFSICCSPS